MTDKPKGPMSPDGERPGSTPELQPDAYRALQTLLRIGSAEVEMLSCKSRADVKRHAQREIAPADGLHLLLSVSEPGVEKPNGSLVLRLLRNRSVHDALVGRYIDRLEYVLLQHNQYLLFGERERAQARRLYEVFLRELQSKLVAHTPIQETEPGDVRAAAAARQSLGEVVVDLHVRLWQFARDVLKRQLGVAGATLPSASAGVGHLGLAVPPCHEYHPEFQLALWRLQPRELREPILDLGCGEQALLVRYLRAAGLEAWGLDRFGGESEYVRVGDWLDAPLEPNFWGTIISHMGFSNHFFHHHLRKDGHPEKYARRFMDIINALQPGGRFLYAPGLPFFEPLLPEQLVQVVTHPVEIDPDTLEAAVQWDGSGDTLDLRQPGLYATEVRRI